MEKKYVKKEKELLVAIASQKGGSGKIRLYGTAGQCPALP